MSAARRRPNADRHLRPRGSGPGDTAADLRPRDDAPCVTVAGVTARYDGGPTVLDHLDLTAPAGGITAILGPNGVGKTTLLNVILGWHRPEAGHVALFGRDLAALSRDEAGRTVSLVPQDEHIPFEYSLLDYVLLGRTPHLNTLAVPGEDDRRRAVEALERVGLDKRAYNPVTETSGGEKQLVMIARSLCQDTPLLVLDEPAAHLDLANRRRLVNLITDLRDTHRRSVLFTTHDPDLAAVAADEIILLRDGGSVIQGSPGEVLTGDTLSATFGIPLEVHWRGRHPHIVW